MKIKEYILDNQGREWALTADLDGKPYETDDGKGNNYMVADTFFDDIFLEIVNAQGKTVHILYYKDMDAMRDSGLFDKATLKALDEVAQEMVLQDSQEWKQCGHDLAQ